MSMIGRDLEHPPWCVDHRHEMVGPHGECHGEKHHSLLDEYGYGLEAHVSWYDGDRGPQGFIAYLAGPNGEQFANLGTDAIDLLVDLFENHPEEALAMLRHLGATFQAKAHA